MRDAKNYSRPKSTVPSATSKGRRSKDEGRLAPQVAKLQPSTFTLQPSYRIGFGNDVHRLVPGRKLILGGVRIPFAKGPLGHSDGDALAHAVCDALLGAAALGDIGRHFSNTAPRWKDASSLEFLRHVRDLLDGERLVIVNIDATIEIERPRLAPYIDRMRQRVARALGIVGDQVSVKAKSGEGIGEIGRGEAVRAEAVAMLRRQ